MSRSPRPGAPRSSPEWRARVSAGLRRYYERRRYVAKVVPSDLAAIRTSGQVPAHLAPFLEAAHVEAEALIEALGGPDALSPQRCALVHDVARVGLVMRAELARYVQSGEGDSAARVGTLAGQRRATLQALGLDRVTRELDLESYLRKHAAEKARQAGPDGANGEAEDLSPAPARDRRATGDAGSVPPQAAAPNHSQESRP